MLFVVFFSSPVITSVIKGRQVKGKYLEFSMLAFTFCVPPVSLSLALPRLTAVTSVCRHKAALCVCLALTFFPDLLCTWLLGHSPVLHRVHLTPRAMVVSSVLLLPLAHCSRGSLMSTRVFPCPGSDLTPSCSPPYLPPSPVVRGILQKGAGTWQLLFRFSLKTLRSSLVLPCFLQAVYSN